VTHVIVLLDYLTFEEEKIMRKVTNTQHILSVVLARLVVPGLLVVVTSGLASGQSQEPLFHPFHLEEATIGDVRRAIKEGQITCQGLVQAYINRAKAYNGICTQLVTKDGAPIPPATGAVRAGSPLKFPTDTSIG
jgi:hypothetical protein